MGDEVKDVTKEEQAIMEVFSHLNGLVLTYIEAALPDKTQRDSLKKLTERAIYDSRNQLLEKNTV